MGDPDTFDVVVIGAGAAGLMAAAVAGERGRRVVLLEKNARPGLKILISGGGRCNVTTTFAGAAVEREYGTRRGRWLRHALRSYPPAALRADLEAAGVALQEEALDKVFPRSGRAADVLDALLARAQRAGVELRCEAAMRSVVHDGERFVVTTSDRTVSGASLVLATGGLSYPRTGTTGDGYPVARQFGHTVTATVPHLAPLRLDESWVHELAGIVVSATVEVLVAGEVVVTRRRPLLFTHKGLSGPAAMDVAGFVEEAAGAGVLRIDFAPDTAAELIDVALREGAARAGKRPVWSALPVELPERLRRTLVVLADADCVLAELDRTRRRAVVARVKELELPVARSLGYGAAEVTRGGIALEEVDARTCQSRCQPGLFLCGEVLDVDGPIGGFNFQAAFATGRIAGANA